MGIVRKDRQTDRQTDRQDWEDKTNKKCFNDTLHILGVYLHDYILYPI